MPLSNREALDLFEKMKHDNIPLCKIEQIFQVYVAENETINSDALIRKLRRTNENLRKKKGKYRTEFEELKFEIPVGTTNARDVNKSIMASFETEAANLAIKSMENTLKEQQIEIKNRELLCEEQIEASKHLQEETIKKMAEKGEKMKREVEDWKTKAKKLRYENLLLKRKRKRDEMKIITAKKYQKLDRDFSNLLKKDQDKSQELLTLKSEYKVMQTELKKLQSGSPEIKPEGNNDSTKEIFKLKNNIRSLEQEKDYLLNMLDEDVEMKLFDEDSGSYTPKVRECIMKLTSLNVATKNIPPVIETVLGLANKVANKLPSRQTVDNIVCEKVAIGQKHIGMKLGQKKNLCLYGDETRKKGKTYQTFLASNEEKEVFFLGLRDMHNKAASTTMDTFKEILSDISNACEEMIINEDVSVGHAIISNIQSFMSDRAKVNISFTELLQQYKSEILSKIEKDWENLSNDQKLICSKVNNFFCALHLLVNMADCTSPILKKFEAVHANFESNIVDDSETDQESECYFSTSEAKTITLMRCCSKCFSCGGDEKCGTYAEFKVYCSSRDEKVLFIPFRGNRFNIIFFIAEVVYYHRETISTFLNNVHGITNNLHKIIAHLIQNPIYLAACKVLGLISKLITAPFWRIIEKNLNILDLNTYFESLTIYLERQSKDALGFVNGDEYPFEESLIEKDNLYEKLVKPNAEVDTFAIQLAQLLFCGFHKLVSNALKEHLPGGTYSNPSEKLKEQSKSVVPHNKMSERVFGMLDNFISFRPNASTITNEAFIMFSFNKTAEWLDTLPEGEKSKMISKSISEGRELRTQFKERCNDIVEKRRQILEEKKIALAKKEQNLLTQREKQTNEIAYYGLWQSRGRVDAALGEIDNEKEKRKALEAQLRFRQKMLKQKHENKEVFKFSSKGKKHPISLLKENLLKLIDAAYHGPDTEPQRIKTPLLVGKRVKHRFSDGNYTGRVISVVPGFVSFYNIVYDNDVAEDGITKCVYTYKLLDDYKKGDLEIIPEVSIECIAFQLYFCCQNFWKRMLFKLLLYMLDY